jgi:hypothetical protein
MHKANMHDGTHGHTRNTCRYTEPVRRGTDIARTTRRSLSFTATNTSSTAPAMAASRPYSVLASQLLHELPEKYDTPGAHTCVQAEQQDEANGHW